ncbi:MAG: hypothetical protein H6932_08910 [Burkholderiaceae bacterium]|nr:hypothetical protein [Rhodoferax sp.]MCP5271341.1 hypothetical protein [Burkholderiaceae bacterium]
MSLTDTQRVFASIHESALNDLLRAFFTARPRYLRYGSPAFVPATNVTATQMPAIAFPGLPGGIDWAVQFEIPRVDLHDPDDALPPQLSLPPGGFSLRTAVKLCINCVKRRDDRGQGKDPTGKPNDDDRSLGEVTCTELGVFAIGHLDSWNDASGNGEIRLRVDAVELVDITPDSLESVLECLIRMLLDAALSQVHLPISALRAGAFQLLVTQGPLIDQDHVLARGNV